MKITTKDVAHVATLARLQFSNDEVKRFTHQLNDILGYFEKLQQVATTDVPPSTHAVEVKNVFRPDVVRDSLPIEEAVSNAPDSEQTCFKVPKIIEV